MPAELPSDDKPSGPGSRESTKNAFEEHADLGDPGILAEFWDFLVHNKKWWLTPIILVLLLFGVLIMLTSTVAAPFIYTLW